MIRAVLDANVFVSAALSPRGSPAKIITAWRAERFDLVISPAILEEIGRVFHYPKVAARHGWPPEKIRLFIEDLAHLAILTPGERSLKVIAEDPSDNRYLECAVEGSAEYVVTGDQHLLRLGAYQRIRILTPKEFLDILAFHRSR
ncbi:MAG TPA: putative toxin-antitoxin system toxin component, PIN family [Candidatus Methylomirabilis sp.]|jgi:putative PIN family toxin of toxin-antitoxin system